MDPGNRFGPRPTGQGPNLTQTRTQTPPEHKPADAPYSRADAPYSRATPSARAAAATAAVTAGATRSSKGDGMT